ncbi:uncharacterized mitochondrial protein-like protein [Tanacetum coccineum]
MKDEGLKRQRRNSSKDGRLQKISLKIIVKVRKIYSTNKELCTAFEKLMKDKFQMSSMGELTFFLGLQVQQKEDGIFISQDKYVAEILKKFNYTDVKSASTLVDLEKPLVKDGDADDVDVHLYRSMIGSLMYLTASRPDIMFAVCACARFQVTPKTSHLLAVKRIFRYLKGKPTLGLWYSRDSPFELVAYTDSDYARATQDRKSTTGGFDASCHGQVKRVQDTKIPQSSGPPVMVGDEAVHKELGDRMERAATTASSLEAEQDSDAQTRFETTSKQSNDPPLSRVNTLRSGEDSLKLTELMAHCTTLTNEDGDRGITTTIDRKVKVIVSEASIRIHLKLKDSECLKTLPTAEIFEQLAFMGSGRFDETQINDQPEEQLGVFSAATALADAARRRRSIENVQTYIKRRREVSTGSGGFSTASKLVSTVDISIASELDSTASVKAKDKRQTKKVFEEEKARFNAEQEARFEAEQEQERNDFETALELQKQLDEREEVAAKVNEAHDIDGSDPAILRYHTLQNRPFSVAEVRKNIVWDQNQAFIPMGSEVEKEVMKRSGFDLQQESSKPIEEEIVQQDDVIDEQAVKESSRTAGGKRKKSLDRKRENS